MARIKLMTSNSDIVNIFMLIVTPLVVPPVFKWMNKVDISSRTNTWADGDANFDNVWDNRESLTYS